MADGPQPANATGTGAGANAGRANPTPLDAIFIIFSAVTLLLFLLWALPGGESKYANAPPFLIVMVKSVWGKVSFAGGSAGALFLRRYFDKSPSPNYLIWIPAFMTLLIAALILLSKAFPQPVQAGAMAVPVSIRLDKQLDELAPIREKYRIADFNLWEEQPDPPVVPHGVYYRPENDPRFPYQDQINVQQDGESLAFIKLYPLASQTAGANEAFDYAICLHANAMQSSQAGRPRIMLSCTNGVCTPDRPGYVVSVDCDAKGAKTDGKASNSGAVIPVVLAAEQVQRSRESGWDVPSAEILEKMTDRERIGYTLFSVDFTPQGEAAQADSYYYELRANGQPIYIDGLSPGLKKESLQKGTVNHISFALENLNFSGQFDGYEKLHLTIFFVKGNTEIYHQDLDRDYVALRDAAEIPPLQTAVGTFRWTGKYIVPRNENKYELLLASADCGDPPGKSCIDRAVYAKSRFDKARFSFDDKPTVMVIRPPLRKPPAYGLALGVVQPTSQVQFTFNASEVGELCRWAVDHVGQGKGGNVIQSDLRRYDVATRGYAPCK